MHSNGNGSSGPVYAQKGQRTVFGAFELGLTSHELLKHGLKVRLPPKSFELLAALVARPGSVVTREELKAQLWPNEATVDFETCLNTAAYRLRVTLGDTADRPRYIETLPRLGYRFVAPVEELGRQQSIPARPDDLEAVRQIVETLAQFQTDDQERVLRWVAEKLGIKQVGQVTGVPSQGSST